jgi:hypothetical protein
MATKEKAPETSEISRDRSQRALDEQAIRSRAYEISQSERAGTPEENWYRAEQELRADDDVG